MKSPIAHHHVKFVSALLGTMLGIGAPLGWLFLRAIWSHPGWLEKEFREFGSFYAYMTFGTVVVFSVFGFLLGRRSDVAVDETDDVKKELDKVHEMAFTDALTGLNNARYLHDQLSIQLELARRYHIPLSCLMMDIDGFKNINDSMGHPFGDLVLITLGQKITNCVRSVDIAGRLGGEEFLVIMPHTNGMSAFSIAERIRMTVQKTEFREDDNSMPVTISVGVACFPSEGIIDKSGLLKAADDALYNAKRAGKNRTVAFSRPQEQGITHV